MSDGVIEHDADTVVVAHTHGDALVALARDKHPDGATSLVTATTGWFRDVVLDRRLRTECRMG